MATVNDIVAALQPQPQSVAVPPLGTLAATPMSDADQAAMSPETFANPAVTHAIGSLMTLPRQAIENSQNSLDTGNYDPGPTLEAAMLPMGTGAIAGVPVRAGEAILGAGPIRAFHGSPHDFDAFSLDKIGTGEGAQAYGHGLYFADQEATAKAYRDQLSYMNKSLNGERLYGNESPAHGMLSEALDAGTGVDGAIAKAQQTYDDFTKGPNASYRNAQTAKQALDQLQEWKTSGADIAHDPGHMYEVNVNADPEHFLDWDKPLSEQHPQTQEALKQAMGPNWDQFKYAKAGDAVKQGFLAPGADTTATRLRDAGIPGIKYLDQGSRAAGDGSRNYVLFDDKMVDIMRKYGMGSVAALPPAALLAAGGSEQKQ